jgi:hypothetical protein
MSDMSPTSNRFRVAFSFSGEKRGFVAETARILSGRFGEAAILYDKYHRAEFARRDLKFYLPELYLKESELIVVVFSASYEGKDWCGGLEWHAIFDLLMQRKDHMVMLCRFNGVNVRGLSSGAGYLDLDGLTPEEFARLILERLSINEGSWRNSHSAKADEPASGRSKSAYTLFESCRFDLDALAEESMRTFIDRKGLIGLALRCHSLTLLEQFCERFRLEIGLGNISVRRPLVINPKFKPVENGVAHVLKHRGLLEVQHVLMPVHISDEESAGLFWSSLGAEFSGGLRHKLILLLAVGDDCAFPQGTVPLGTPLFQRVHAYRWAREVVGAMRWPEDLIEHWVDSMVVECEVNPSELHPEQVYIHLDETTKFIKRNPDPSDFRAELKRRVSVYVPS